MRGRLPLVIFSHAITEAHILGFVLHSKGLKVTVSNDSALAFDASMKPDNRCTLILRMYDGDGAAALAQDIHQSQLMGKTECKVLLVNHATSGNENLYANRILSGKTIPNSDIVDALRVLVLKRHGPAPRELKTVFESLKLTSVSSIAARVDQMILIQKIDNLSRM